MNDAASAARPLRLLAASLCLMPGSVVEQLLAMRRNIYRYNTQHGLCTALLHAGGWFVQWHEGPAGAVDRTLAISRSHRTHSHLRIIHRSVGPGCLADPVQMATLHGPDKPTDVARRLHELGQQRDSARELDPVEIWERLSAPLIGPFAAGQGLRKPHRLIAITSESGESVDLVKAMAERCRVPVLYQRFANGDGRNGDAGAAYADIGCAGSITRVHALSRQVLANSMVGLVLRHLHCLVLLVGHAPKPATFLAHAASAFLAGVPARPAIRFLGPDIAIARLAADALGPCGTGDLREIVAGVPGRSHVDALLDLIATPRPLGNNP